MIGTVVDSSLALACNQQNHMNIIYATLLLEFYSPTFNVNHQEDFECL